MDLLNTTFVCIGVLLIVAASLLRHSRERRSEDRVTAIAYCLFIAAGVLLQGFIARHVSKTIDPELLHLDRALGLDTLQLIGNFVHRSWPMPFLILLYVALPVMIASAWIAEQDIVARRAVVLSGMLCFVFYAIFPAVGPNHFNWMAGRPESFAPRNCIPSMHVSWALLIAWNARSRRLRVILWSYAGLVALATLAVGEHYLIDLLAAVPYCAVIQGLSSANYSALFSRLALLTSPGVVSGSTEEMRGKLRL